MDNWIPVIAISVFAGTASVLYLGTLWFQKRMMELEIERLRLRKEGGTKNV